MGCAPALQAQTQWQTVEPSPLGTTTVNSWKPVPTQDAPANAQIWEPLSPEEELLEPDQLVWTEPTVDQDASDERGNIAIADEKTEGDKSNQEVNEEGFRWPNGQLMSEADQIYYRSAWSRGSMVQIGDTVYPNLGINALQRHPESWINIQFAGIDDTWQQAPSPCDRGDFFDQCSDLVSVNYIRLWNSKEFSLDLEWTIHGLSGDNAPFNLQIGDTNIGSGDTGNTFGDGQSLGFRLAKNFGKTWGISFGGKRLFHLDEQTDLRKNLYLLGTKIVRLNDTIEPPILTVSLGIMSDVHNPETNIGTIRYPDWLRGGVYPSSFAELYDGENASGSGRKYYPNVAGTTSAQVCADRTYRAGKSADNSKKGCVEEVSVGPVASIGFAPWPWIGVYASYTKELNFGISFKPFKEFHWTFSIEAISPIPGIHPIRDRNIENRFCPGENGPFDACRTRVGIFTDFSF